MDLLHSWGVELAVYLQTQYSSYEGLFSLASTVADLHTAFFWLFPIWFHLQRDTGLRLIWVAVIGDWLNLVLKWVLFGERPYWWVRETGSMEQTRSRLCSSSPSHVKLDQSLRSCYGCSRCLVCDGNGATLHSNREAMPLFTVQMFLWTLLGLVELVVCMSRVYMAAHFPHQVVAGKWCIRPEWVHLDTTPFASLLRNMGTLFGLGLGLHSPLYSQTKKKKTSAAFKMGCIVISLLLLQLLDGWTFSSGNLTTFYFLSFAKSAVALLIPTTLVPGALCRIFKGKREDKKL
ncbi:hypothetical protein INR49_005862 [Caranx melampygus]|nr:hypothetical protein INR49_005862 [Caranx melampygus]